MPMIACDKCDVLNPAKAQRCVECGEPLSKQTPPPLPAGDVQHDAPKAAPRRRSRRDLDPEQVERSRQRQEFGRIKNIVFTVRSVYLAGAMFAVVQLLCYHLILARVFYEQDAGTVSLVVGGVSWAQLGLMAAGARFVKRAPFPWTLVGAAYWTLGTAQAWWIATLADGVLLQDSRVMAWLTMMGLMVFAFWFAVGQANRVQRLMQANPELQLERKRLRPEDLSLGGIAEEATQRSRRNRQHTNAAHLRIIVVSVAVLLLGGGGVWAMTRPPVVEDAAERFAERWAAMDLPFLGKMFVGGEFSRQASDFGAGLEQRGWHKSAPTLADPKCNGNDKVAIARFACDDDEVVTRWQFGAAGWRLQGVSLPGLVTKDLEGGVAAFRSAWASPGTDALLAMVRPADQRAVGSRLSRILKGRDWSQQRPPLGDDDPGRVSSSGRSSVLFEFEGDELRVTLKYWRPSWYIVGLRLPRR